MGRKVFVSYKHNDTNVQYLNSYGDTARAYVDYLIDNRLNDEIYKGEENEDLSQFKDDTIKNRLKNKIHDSSISIVLISPNMKEPYTYESEQWIPWEISYSLKEITRSDKTSHPNGILAIVLPDRNGSYTYFINESCSCCKQLQIDTVFQIIRDNMFNAKDKEEYKGSCNCCGRSIYGGNPSYIETVKWGDFLSNKNYYLDKSVSIRDNRKSYNITKEVRD
jgi:hypothetical protein